MIAISHCTHIGHRVVATGRSDAQKLHMRVSLHRLKDLFQCWDGNVLQHRQRFGSQPGSEYLCKLFLSFSYIKETNVCFCLLFFAFITPFVLINYFKKNSKK